MKLQIVKGSTSQIITVFIQDSSSTTGAGLGGLDQTSSIVGGQVRAGSTGVALAVDENVTTEGTYEAPSAAGKVRIGTPANMTAGTYELHVHNDLFASGADSIFITLGGASNMAVLVIEIQLTDFDLNATGGDAPATQDQVSQIGSGGGSANNEFAILEPNGFVITTGLSEVNNEDATRASEGDVHQISDNAGTMDVYYLFDIAGAFSPNTIVHTGRMNGNNDDVGVYVNTNTQASPTWVQRATLLGSNSSVNLERSWKLVNSDQMVGVDAGKVAVRFFATGLSSATLTTDQIVVEKTTIASVTGYQDGQVWVRTVGGTAGTVPDVNGVADNHVLTWADALTIATSKGFTDFHIINGSTIALTGTSDNLSLFGDNWILQLANRSVAGAYFQGAHVSGVGTSATEVHYEGCDVATMSVQIGHFDFCSFSGTVTHTLAGDYNYHNCYSNVAGSGGPTFAKTAGQAITAQWRGWKGSINLTGLEVGDTLTIGGDELGTIDLGSPAGAVVVEIRGIYKELVNVGSASVNLDGAILAADVAQLLANLGTPVALDGAAATLAAMLTKLADDNGGADFDATTDSQQAIRDNTGTAGVGLTNLGGMSTGMKAEVNAEVDTALNTAIPGGPAANSINERIVAIDDIVPYMPAGIYIDTVGGTAGTTKGTHGTRGNPSNSVANAVTLAAAVGVNEYRLLGASSITLTTPHTNWAFYGQNGANVNVGAQNTSGSHFECLTLTGDMDGNDTTQRFCKFQSLTNFIADATFCLLIDNVTESAGDHYWFQCASGVAGTGTPYIDVDGNGVNARNNHLRGWLGGVEMRTHTSADLTSFDCPAGQIVVAATGTGGTIAMRGNMDITDNASGAVTFSENAAVNTSKINAQVVDVIRTDTTGEPGQGEPPEAASLSLKLDYIYKALTNLQDQTATLYQLYNRAGDTVDQKAPVSDDNTTATRNKLVTGP